MFSIGFAGLPCNALLKGTINSVCSVNNFLHWVRRRSDVGAMALGMRAIIRSGIREDLGV